MAFPPLALLAGLMACSFLQSRGAANLQSGRIETRIAASPVDGVRPYDVGNELENGVVQALFARAFAMLLPDEDGFVRQCGAGETTLSAGFNFWSSTMLRASALLSRICWRTTRARGRKISPRAVRRAVLGKR
jgi:hypothetical protein